MTISLYDQNLEPSKIHGGDLSEKIVNFRQGHVFNQLVQLDKHVKEKKKTQQNGSLHNAFMLYLTSLSCCFFPFQNRNTTVYIKHLSTQD
jgi:hypothetical protein